MNLFLCIAIHTANILGIFTDPFEFEGDYGPEVTPTRQKVFELIVSKEALSKNLTDDQIKKLLENPSATQLEINNYRKLLIDQAIEKDLQHGPTFSELVTPDLIAELAIKQQTLKAFTEEDFSRILYFLKHYGSKKVFYFFRNNPPELLSLDKILRDKASETGKSFNLPILSSTETLEGQNSFELKKDLLNSIFTDETLKLTKPEKSLKKILSQLENRDLEIFSSPAGQAFFYWAYQSLNLHLIAKDPSLIQEINKVKKQFANTLGNSEVRASSFKEKLLAADSKVVFTQESDLFVVEALTKKGPFLPVTLQNPKDGCFIFLRQDFWEPDYKLIEIEGYEGFKEGKMVVALARQKETGTPFLLASCHGHSTRPEDGRLQISLVMETFRTLSKQPENKNLQLLIGIDANTKTEKAVEDLRSHLKDLGLTATNSGPTTIKQRMVTAQHAKAGKIAIDEEDYLITLTPENGGQFSFSHQTIGFKEEGPDSSIPLPNADNPSDHYPIGANLDYKSVCK